MRFLVDADIIASVHNNDVNISHVSICYFLLMTYTFLIDVPRFFREGVEVKKCYVGKTKC